MVLVIILGVFFFLIAGFLSYFVMIYNGLIVLSRNIAKSWANIDVLLKQRHDEISKLIKICEGYMKYEKETLEKLTAARTACLQAKTVGESSQAEGELGRALKSLFAVAENYPDLKANQNFLQLQQRASYLESQIADRREFYNDSVMQYNEALQVFPKNIFAKLFNFQPREFFETKGKEREAVKVTF